jgi:hypothetical protein
MLRVGLAGFLTGLLLSSSTYAQPARNADPAREARRAVCRIEARQLADPTKAVRGRGGIMKPKKLSRKFSQCMRRRARSSNA